MGSISAVRFSPDGGFLASAADQFTRLRLWSVTSGESLREWTSDFLDPVDEVIWSPHGETVAARFLGGGVFLWDVKSGLQLPPLLEKSVAGRVVWSPDKGTVALVTDKIRLIDVASRDVVQEFGEGSHAVAWSPDASELACGNTIYDVQSGDALRSLSETLGSISVLAWSPDGKTLAGAADEDNVFLWDSGTGLPLCPSLKGHQTPVRLLRWLDNGNTLASGSESEVCIWDTKPGRLSRTLPGPCAALSPEGRLIATCGESMIRLRSLDDNQPLRTILALRDSQYALISHDGHYRGSPGAEEELVYVVQTDQGQETLAPETFRNMYGWTNDPTKVNGK